MESMEISNNSLLFRPLENRSEASSFPFIILEGLNNYLELPVLTSSTTVGSLSTNRVLGENLFSLISLNSP